MFKCLFGHDWHTVDRIILNRFGEIINTHYVSTHFGETGYEDRICKTCDKVEFNIEKGLALSAKMTAEKQEKTRRAEARAKMLTERFQKMKKMRGMASE